MESPDTPGQSSPVEVVVAEGGKAAPCCRHGPALLFEKVIKGGGEPRRFYACSACRDRKDCSFFQWEDEKVSEIRLKARQAENKFKKHWNSFVKFQSLALGEHRFCEECQLLLLPAEHGAHSAHRVVGVTPAQLRRPSSLLRPLDNKKSHAQYLFTQRSTHFLLDALTALGFSRVLCVGTPRLHESIHVRNLDQNHRPIKSLLLDMDSRYSQFFQQGTFIHYNMFNHHFFDGQSAQAELQAFLTPPQLEAEPVVMVADPPFGGLVKALAQSFTLISHTWRDLQHSVCGELPMLWVFPYFFESRILECLPSFSMLDYQVDYDNHPLYKHGKTGRKQSPVRLFTNISARDFILPRDEGYRLCSVCDRYVCSLNKHCTECNVCPSKDGREWRHCSSCEKCVKPSWSHCTSCGRCCLPDHGCGQAPPTAGCFTCGSLTHKRNSCPRRTPRDQRRSRKSAPPALFKKKTKRKSGAARRASKSV